MKKRVPILLLLMLAAHCSSYSRIPAPYKETFSQPASTVKLDRSETDWRMYYSPGVVRPTPPDQLVKSDTGAVFARHEFVVMLRNNASTDSLLSDLKKEKIPGSIVGYIPTFRMAQILILENGMKPDEVVAKLSRLPSVETATPHFVRIEKRSATSDWHIRKYGIEKVWKINNGANVRCAILDSGIDVSLPAWGNRLRYPYSVLTRSEKFEDGQVKKAGDVLRVVDHGTRVASVTAAEGQPGGLLPGVAPGAEIMPIQVIGFHVSDESIYTNDLTIVEGLARAMAFHAQIINVSLGTDYARALRESVPEAREKILRQIQVESAAVRAIYDRPFEKAQELNVWIVVAAGNSADSAENEPIASHPYVISVGALDAEDQRAPFSNFGHTVSTYAPGVGVLTLIPGGTLVASSGTSFSAPYVTGVLALLRSENRLMTFAEAKQKIELSNIMARTSILATEKEIPIFDPTGLLFGPYSKFRSSKRTFYELYHHLYIQPGDSDAVKLDKILRYYAIRREYYGREPEAVVALPLIVSNFSVVRSHVETRLDFYAASLIADAALTPEQIEYLRLNIQKSDFIAIVMGSKNDRASIPALIRRLNRKEFNANTLSTLWHFNEPGTHEHIASYARLLHKSPEWAEDEGFAMLGIVNTSTNLSEEDRRLLTNSFNRYKINFYKTADLGYVDRNAESVVQAMTLAGEKDGILLALDALDLIHRRLALLEKATDNPWETPKGFGNSREELGQRLQSLQTQINESTSFPVKYNHQASYANREATRNLFIQYLKTARFENGRFSSK